MKKAFFFLTNLLALSFLVLSCRSVPPDGRRNLDPEKKVATDVEILENLLLHKRLQVEEMGGGGDCLFHSLRTQITQNDLQLVDQSPVRQEDQIDFTSYDPTNSNPENSTNFLRKLAVQRERIFLNHHKNTNYNDLPSEGQRWALEMAKDFYQEFEHTAQETHKWFSEETDKEKLWNYVKANKKAYFQREVRQGCWGGTSEAIALAKALGRGLRMYGQDVVSGTKIRKKDLELEVRPYFSIPSVRGVNDLLVFQTNGGGHYKILKPISLRAFTAYDIGQVLNLYLPGKTPDTLNKEDLHLLLHPRSTSKEEIKKRTPSWTHHELEPHEINSFIENHYTRSPSSHVMINFRTHGYEASGSLGYKSQNDASYRADHFIRLLENLNKMNQKLRTLKQLLINPSQCFHKEFMSKVESYLNSHNLSFQVAYFTLKKNIENNTNQLPQSLAALTEAPLSIENFLGTQAFSIYEHELSEMQKLIQNIGFPELKTLEDLNHLKESIYLLAQQTGAPIDQFELKAFKGNGKDFSLSQFFIPQKLSFTIGLKRFPGETIHIQNFIANAEKFGKLYSVGIENHSNHEMTFVPKDQWSQDYRHGKTDSYLFNLILTFDLSPTP